MQRTSWPEAGTIIVTGPYYPALGPSIGLDNGLAPFFFVAHLVVYNSIIFHRKCVVISNRAAINCISSSKLATYPYHMAYLLWMVKSNIVFNTLRLRQMAVIFKGILLNEHLSILIEISLQFVPRCLIYNIRTLVHIMAWRRPLSDQRWLVFLRVCVTWPQWVNKMNDMNNGIFIFFNICIDRDLRCILNANPNHSMLHSTLGDE